MQMGAAANVPLRRCLCEGAAAKVPLRRCRCEGAAAKVPLDPHWITGSALDPHGIRTGSALDPHWIRTGDPYRVQCALSLKSPEVSKEATMGCSARTRRSRANFCPSCTRFLFGAACGAFSPEPYPGGAAAETMALWLSAPLRAGLARGPKTPRRGRLRRKCAAGGAK